MKNKYLFVSGKLMLIFLLLLAVSTAAYGAGFIKGMQYTSQVGGKNISLFNLKFTNPIKRIAFLPSPTNTPNPATPPPISTTPPKTTSSRPTWGGPELWELVNKTRQQNGVNGLSQKDEICTIAAIRLNELLELGKLDGHEGFSTLPDRREDLRYIYEKYNLTEFLLSGADTAQEAVDLWNNTLAHKKLLTGGEYVWGCIYAQYGFAVAITAY